MNLIPGYSEKLAFEPPLCQGEGLYNHLKQIDHRIPFHDLPVLCHACPEKLNLL